MMRRVDYDVLHRSLLKAKFDGFAPVICGIAEGVVLRYRSVGGHKAAARCGPLPFEGAEKYADIGIGLEGVLPVRDGGPNPEIADVSAEPMNPVGCIYRRGPDGELLAVLGLGC